MKVRFTIDGDLLGYTNINPFQDIDLLIDNECLSIFCDNCIRGCNYENVDKIIATWVQKLRKNGIIEIVGMDLNKLSNDYLYKGSKTLNKCIYESHGIFHIHDIIRILRSLGLNIVEARFLEEKYYIKASR